MGAITAIRLQRVLQRQAWENFVLFGPGDVIRVARPSAGTNPLKPYALELEGLRCTPLEECVLPILPTAVEAFEDGLQNI